MFDTSSSQQGGWGKLGTPSPSQLLYPSPFFDLANTYLPRDIKDLFKWCKYYTLTNPVINAIINKLASYSVTDIVITENDPKVEDRWNRFLNDQLRFQSFQINIGLDYEGYGNAFASIHFPFIKMLKCKRCNHTETISGADYKFVDYTFKLRCHKCNSYDEAIVHDQYIHAPSKIKLIRWNPEYIDIETNRYNGDRVYYFVPPKEFYNDITSGRRAIIENSPQLFLDAAKEHKAVIISKDNIYHLERPSISSQYDGWGTPRIMAILKDAFYTQLMKKANEVLLMEHVIPLRVIHPATGDANANPYEHLNLSVMKRQVAKEIQIWRRDPNYIPIVNFPLGFQQLGGQGKMLLFVNELRSMYEILAAGTGCPQEFVFGGLSYSGSNVSLRMLENDMLRGIEQKKGLLRWVVERVAHYLQWSEVKTDFKPFKMADDLQRLAYYQQLRQSGDISKHSLVSYAGFDPRAEDEAISQESSARRSAMEAQKIAEAEADGKAQAIMARYQAKVQLETQKADMALQTEHMKRQMQEQADLESKSTRDQMELQLQQQTAYNKLDQQGSASMPKADGDLQTVNPQSMENVPVDLKQLAKRLAGHIRQNPEQRSAILKNVEQKLGREMSELVTSMASSQVDTRPLPEQKPPRRGPENAVI